MDEIINQLMQWLDEGKQAAVAVVVKKKGSAMRPVGAKLAICEDGKMAGSVSGGCVESAVITEAQECMRSGQPKLLLYGVSDDTAWSVGLMCGGEIDILILPVLTHKEYSFDRIIIQKIGALQQERKPFMLLMHLSEKYFGQSCILENEAGKIDQHAGMWIEKNLYPVLEEMARNESSGILATQSGEVFVDIGNPSPRLIIIGAAHVSIAIVGMAKIMGMYTILIDPRKAFANRPGLSSANELLNDWPDEALEKAGVNTEDYVLLLSHDDKLDLPAAEAALRAKAKYIGMLASRTTRERRFGLLVERGFSREEVEKIHAPVGMDIGARTPEEIALAILAEITAFRYGRIA